MSERGEHHDGREGPERLWESRERRLCTTVTGEPRLIPNSRASAEDGGRADTQSSPHAGW